MIYVPDMVTVGLIEIPDEISLIIPVPGCGRHCIGCHSPELQKAQGDTFTLDILKNLLKRHKGFISCVCFFEGAYDSDMMSMCKLIKRMRLKTALYTGAEKVDNIALELFDYIKLGPYKPEFGGIANRTSNQRLFYHKKDITYKFWNRTE